MATFREKSIMFEMFIILLIFVSSVLVPVHCKCVVVTQQFSKQNVTLTFHLQGKKTPLQVKHGNIIIYMIMGAQMNLIALSNSERHEVIKSTDQEFSFKIVNVLKRDAGIYTLTNRETGGSECMQLVIKDKPVTIILNQSQPVLRGKYRKGNIALTCNATSTTRPVDHNLPMIYRWFKHGIYYGNGGNSRILQDRDVDITDMGHDIICIATDDPECKKSLENLKQDDTLTTVLVVKGERCEDVLGISNKFILCPEYPNCCPPAEIPMSSDDVALVDVGEMIILLREVTGRPRPSLEVESMILPVGVNNHPRYINYSLINTIKPHHYNLSLSVHVVTKHYLGKYCIYLKNKYGGVLVCHTLKQATNDVVNTSTEITIIIIVIGSFLLLAVFIIGFILVKKCYNSMAPDTRTIPLEHHHDQVAMRQLPTDLTRLNRPTNRTLLRDRESFITSLTQVSSDYARPDSLIVHQQPDYDQQDNLTDEVDDDGDNEDAADGDLNDNNSASLCIGSPTAVPNVYEKLNKNTRNAKLNVYKKLKW